MRQTRGFTLVELLVVLVIIGFLVAMAAVVTRAITAQQRRSVTATRMAGVDSAIVQFVMLQKRLPCPANGTLTAGTEVFPCPNAADQTNGVVPWRTLGLSEADVTDGWERRMTFRVDANLATATKMDISACDPAGTAGLNGAVCFGVPPCSSAAPGSCTPPTTYLNGKGLLVRTTAGVNVMDPAAAPPTGAAYVVISHGETGGGGYLNSGQLYASTTTDGTEEQKNYANLPVRAYYVDDGIMDNPGATHFDDIVSRPTVLTVANKAGLGPRSH